MIEIIKEKPCKYAETLGSIWYECIAYNDGVGCEMAIFDLNPDRTINVTFCGLEEAEYKEEAGE